MADVQLIIKLPEKKLNIIKNKMYCGIYDPDIYKAIENGTPLTVDVLADLLMEERIRGELKQDISYSKDVIDDVKCRLTVDIIDHRPCYCGAALREVWRENKDKK